MRKTLIAKVLAVILILNALAVPSFAYSRANAVAYADKYVLNSNSNHQYFTNGGNCTNFVSQCLYAGGVKMDSIWYCVMESSPMYNQYSSAWLRADSLKNYLKNNLGAERLVSKWTKYGNSSQGVYGYTDNSSNLTNTGIEIVFYDWQDDGIIDHASIIVGTGTALDGTGYGDLIDQNTTDRKHTIWHLDSYNANKLTTAIYAFRLS